MSFFVFVWTLIFLAYVRNNLPRPLKLQLTISLDLRHTSLVPRLLSLLGTPRTRMRYGCFLAVNFRSPCWRSNGLGHCWGFLRNLAKGKRGYWRDQRSSCIGCYHLGFVCVHSDHLQYVSCPSSIVLEETLPKRGSKSLKWYVTDTNTFSLTGIFLHKHRVAHGATGFGVPQQRPDVEKGPNVTEQPVELQYVQQHPQAMNA
jgi:hypothetical protein